MIQLLNKKRKLLGNKGFSLVELIIVIAIMAVLVAILAPQYLQYVEKSRVSADNTAADAITSAVKVMLSDETYTGATDVKVIWAQATNTVTVSGTDKGIAETYLTVSLGKAFASDAFTQKVQANGNKGKTYQWNVTYPVAGQPNLAITPWA